MNRRGPVSFTNPTQPKERLLEDMRSGRRAAASCTRLLEILIREGAFDEAVRVYFLFTEAHRTDRKPGQTLARACAAAGNVTCAVKVYTDLIKRFPGEYPNYKELEKLYLKSGHPRRAIAMYRGMGHSHPLRRKGYKRLTGIYWRLGDLPRAISCLKQEMQEYGSSPKLNRELGKFYMLTRRHVRAIESFQNALAEDKGDRGTRVWLGVSLMENGNYELAEYEFAELLKSKPRDFQALVHLAELRIRENRLPEAREILDEIDLYHPDNSRVKLCRAEIAFLEGRFEEAARLGEGALAQTPFYYVWEQLRCHRILKHAYRALHQPRKAALHGEMQEALRKSRDVFSGLIRVAELKIGSGRPDEGKDILERILDLYPGNTRARVALAEACLRERDDAMAQKIAEGTLKDILPHFTGELVRAHAVLARAYGRLGRRDKAAYHREQRAAYRARGLAR
jgi:tetratricopeptide (TPR) repeat protein